MRRTFTLPRLLALALLAVLALLPLLSSSRFFLHVGTLVALNAAGALALNLVMKTGYVSLAFSPLLGLGTYTSALLVMKQRWPWPAALLASALVAGAVGWLMARLLVRVRGVYYVLATFSFGMAIQLLFVNWVSLFGGVQGLAGIPNVKLLGYAFKGVPSYYLVLACMAVVAGLIWLVQRSVFGQVLQSIYEHEQLTESLGYDTARAKIIAMTLSAGLAGLVGSLYGPFVGFVSPDLFTFDRTIDFVIFNVIGGVWVFEGPVIGAAVFTVLPEFLRGAATLYRLLFGMAVVLFVLARPAGLFVAELDRRRVSPLGRLLRLIAGRRAAGARDKRAVGEG